MLEKWIVALLLFASGAAVAQDGPVIAAASDLKFALDEIAGAFQRQTGRKVRVAYGSSGNFFSQIAQDAPFELFMSADEEYVFRLARQGRVADDGMPYAIGRIVLFVPAGSPVKADAQFADLRRALADGRLRKFAIANPEHAPYGRAAKQALQEKGLWEAIEPRLVLGENVSQAAQFAVSGSAQGGIFALSLARAPAFGNAGSYVLVPQELHQPLKQRMVLTRKAGDVAREFYAYMQQPAARTVFRKYGFALPGEAAD
ncbi:MAG: molybdate ABC transporter substrate-binding protein [Betaproteobacteria bacterium]|nr:molybdate ABC transporter substrate-binding protein [Betaproteobacteria bacterium]